MHYFSNLFDKEFYMFRTDLLSIIRNLNIVFTAIGICHTNYEGWNFNSGNYLFTTDTK